MNKCIFIIHNLLTLVTNSNQYTLANITLWTIVDNYVDKKGNTPNSKMRAEWVPNPGTQIKKTVLYSNAYE